MPAVTTANTAPYRACPGCGGAPARPASVAGRRQAAAPSATLSVTRSSWVWKSNWSVARISLISQPRYAGRYARGTARPSLLGRGRPEPDRREVDAAGGARDHLRQQALRRDREEHRRAPRPARGPAAHAGGGRRGRAPPVQRAPAALRVRAHPGRPGTARRAHGAARLGRPVGGGRAAHRVRAQLRARPRPGGHLPPLRGRDRARGTAGPRPRPRLDPQGPGRGRGRPADAF